MGWERWFSDSHHGKTRSSSSGGRSKTECFVGKRGGGFNILYSVRTNSSGRKTAHAGRHIDKKK
jgi:hypothetical protein